MSTLVIIVRGEEDAEAKRGWIDNSSFHRILFPPFLVGFFFAFVGIVADLLQRKNLRWKILCILRTTGIDRKVMKFWILFWYPPINLGIN